MYGRPLFPRPFFPVPGHEGQYKPPRSCSIFADRLHRTHVSRFRWIEVLGGTVLVEDPAIVEVKLELVTVGVMKDVVLEEKGEIATGVELDA